MMSLLLLLLLLMVMLTMRRVWGIPKGERQVKMALLLTS
jgi:hypothetical protein